MDTFWQDVKYGLRMLVKNPGFTAVAVVTLALGIGANAAIFSVVNSLLLRPLPVKNPEELVVLAVTHEGNQDAHQPSLPDFEDYRKTSDAFSEMAGYYIGFVGLSTGERAERTTVCYVSPNYFSMLGVNAARGRVISGEEGWKPGVEPVLVLGHSYWMKRFGGDPNVVGRSVVANGRPATIIGVLPETFRGTYSLADFDAFLPLGVAASDKAYEESFTRRDNHDLRVLARLKPGVPRQQAQASLDVIASQLEKQYPETNKTVKVHVLPERLARPEPNSAKDNPIVASIFLLLTGLVLLVACVNVANLLLVRATLRQKELAIRAALGAGQGRLARQLLTESVLLSLFGAAGGILIGAWMSRVLASIRLPGDLPFRFDFGLDARVFGYVAAIALLAGIFVGLLPALRTARGNLNDTLREGGRSMAAGAGGHRVRDLLVVSQVMVTLVLLVAAGLFVRSLGNAQSVELGFQPRNVLNLALNPAQQGYDEARGRAFFRELEQRVRTLPGVQAVSIAYSVPMSYYNNAEYIAYEGQALKPDERLPFAGFNVVSLDYFQVMGIPVVKGRGFTTEDTAESRRVAIVNQRMAEKLWPGQDPIGRRFRMKTLTDPLIEVVGMTGNGKYSWIFEDSSMFFYLPQEQRYESQAALQVRTAGPPAQLAVPIQQVIRGLDADLPVYDVMTMEQSLEGGNGFFLIRMGATFAATLGLLGLALAIVGVYGVVSYAASQRTHEIGIRMALGAQPGSILRLIVGQGLKLVLLGAGVGLGLSFWMARFLQRFLFGISSADPLTFGGVALLLGAVALVACWIPAHRAAKVDPMVALRYE